MWELETISPRHFVVYGPGELSLTIQLSPSAKPELHTDRLDSETEIKSLSYDLSDTFIQVVLIGNKSYQQGHLHIGDFITWRIPSIFAIHLMNALQD